MYVHKFFVHGIRWRERAIQIIPALRTGEPLSFRLDDTNPVDKNAVAFYTTPPQEPNHRGYAPRYLAHNIRTLHAEDPPNDIDLTVASVNRDAPLQQRLLCPMQTTWPEGFTPCAGDKLIGGVFSLSHGQGILPSFCMGDASQQPRYLQNLRRFPNRK